MPFWHVIKLKTAPCCENMPGCCCVSSLVRNKIDYKITPLTLSLIHIWLASAAVRHQLVERHETHEKKRIFFSFSPKKKTCLLFVTTKCLLIYLHFSVLCLYTDLSNLRFQTRSTVETSGNNLHDERFQFAPRSASFFYYKYCSHLCSFNR